MKSLHHRLQGQYLTMFILCLMLAFPRNGECRIIRVPEQYLSIQQAINAATNGDTVLVNDGFYPEQINFLGKNIVVSSRFIMDNDSVHIFNTEINRSYLNEGVKFINGEGPSAQLIGFTISNCLWKAVYCKNSSPSIRSNIIRGNKAVGVYLDASAATITDNAINCYPGFDMGGPYDAIHLFNSGPVVERNTINCNDLAGNVHAIDFDLWNSLLPGVSTNISGNRIVGELFGGLPDNGLPQLIQHNIIISGNGFSSAMNITECAPNLKIFNNTVTGGGGIWIQGGNLPDIRNNIVAYANNGIELWDSATVAFNNVWKCKQPYSGISDQTGINGNISADPGFRDPENGDFHFFCWSPCIDAGDPLSVYSLEPSPNGGRINMGCYGNTPEADQSVPCMRIFPENIDFGYVPVNMHKDTAVIIRNAGHAQLNISGITNSNINSFGTGYPGGTTLLNPNDSISLGITFHPPANMIHYSDSVIIASNSATPGKIHLAGHTALHVNNNEARERFELYPVPVTGDHLYVKTSTPWPRNILVEIVKTSGEIVCSEIQHPTDDQPLKINTGSLKDGAYCLRINAVSLFFVILRKMN